MNLQTWVVFLEFFGIGRAPEDLNMAQQQEPVSVERETGGTFLRFGQVIMTV